MDVLEYINRKTTSLLVPLPTITSTTTSSHSTSTSHSASSSSSHGPAPTVVPTPPIVQSVGDAGKRTLWVVFILMLLSTIIFAALAYRVPVQKRLFHILTTFITAFATISYFAMATGDGNSYSTVIEHHSHKNGPDTRQAIHRQVFYARYIDWSITTPLLLLDLALLAGLSGANILVVIVADLVMVLTGLFAAYGHQGIQRWGYYAIAWIAFIIIIYQLAVAGRRNAAARDSKTAAFYSSLGLFTLIVWTAYPIVWAIGDGSRRISVDGEVIAYAILDILAKPVFGFWLLITHDKIPSTNLHLDGAWSHGFGKREGLLRVGDDDEGA